MIWRAVAVLLLVLLTPPVAAEEQAPLRIGLQPTNATLSLLNLYHPLREHLGRNLGRTVELYTAPSFREYLDALAAEEFDMLVAAPHFGALALDFRYRPLFRYRAELSPVIVLSRAGGIQSGADLRGRRVLTADPLTAVSVVAEHWLRTDFDLAAGRDYQLVPASNHLTAIRAVALGDADAAITTPPAVTQVPADIRALVDTLPCRLSVPGQFLMAHRRLDPETLAALVSALARFGDTEDGKAFFAKGYQGLVRLTDADVKAARPYAEPLRALLERR